MAKFNFSRIIPVALILVIIAISIAALVSLARVVFFSGTSNQATTIDTSQQSILDTSADRSVSMVVRGPIVADELFKSYQIIVTPSSRTLTTYKGYLDQPTEKIALGNNTPAYEQFVYALNKANMMKGTELTGDKNDLRGVCAVGSLYEYQILKANSPVKSLWTSSCAGSKGSLNASVEQLTRLFVVQIPESKTIIDKLW